MVLFRNVSDDLVQVLHVTSLHRALMRTCFQGGKCERVPVRASGESLRIPRLHRGAIQRWKELHVSQSMFEKFRVLRLDVSDSSHSTVASDPAAHKT
jgi:hypothetical protein